MVLGRNRIHEVVHEYRSLRVVVVGQRVGRMIPVPREEYNDMGSLENEGSAIIL